MAKICITLFVLTLGFIAVICRDYESEYNEKSCPKRCSEEYRPLCARNENGKFKVFVNDCYLAMENCDQKPNEVYRQCPSSECPEFSEWTDSDWENDV